MDEDQSAKMAVAAFKRILESESKFSMHVCTKIFMAPHILCSEVVSRGAGQAKAKITVNLVTMFGQEFNKSESVCVFVFHLVDLSPSIPSTSPPSPVPVPPLPLSPPLPSALLEYILEDFRARFDVATAWLFAEYSIVDHTHQHSPSKYSVCLTELMLGAKVKLNPRDRLFTKLVLEAPKVTREALQIIRSYCQDEVREEGEGERGVGGRERRGKGGQKLVVCTIFFSSRRGHFLGSLL